MDLHYLKQLFLPEYVAIFGASDRIDSVGQIVLSNMLKSDYKGALFLINLKHKEIHGRKAYASLFQVSEIAELAVIITPAQTVPDIIENCEKRGIKAAVIRVCGTAKCPSLWNIRMLGSNCLVSCVLR